MTPRQVKQIDALIAEVARSEYDLGKLAAQKEVIHSLGGITRGLDMSRGEGARARADRAREKLAKAIVRLDRGARA